MPPRRDHVQSHDPRARLEVGLFEEVERDTSATTQALLVVVIVAVLMGLGALGHSMAIGGNNSTALFIGVVRSVITWALFSLVAYFVGVKVLPEPSTEGNWGQLARTIGFAQAPGALNILSPLPVLGPVISFVALVWVAAAAALAIRQALDYKSTMRAVIVAVIALLVGVLVLVVASAFTSGPAPS